MGYKRLGKVLIAGVCIVIGAACGLLSETPEDSSQLEKKGQVTDTTANADAERELTEMLASLAPVDKARSLNGEALYKAVCTADDIDFFSVRVVKLNEQEQELQFEFTTSCGNIEEVKDLTGLGSTGDPLKCRTVKTENGQLIAKKAEYACALPLTEELGQAESLWSLRAQVCFVLTEAEKAEAAANQEMVVENCTAITKKGIPYYNASVLKTNCAQSCDRFNAALLQRIDSSKSLQRQAVTSTNLFSAVLCASSSTPTVATLVESEASYTPSCGYSSLVSKLGETGAKMLCLNQTVWLRESSEFQCASPDVNYSCSQANQLVNTCAGIK